MHPDPKQGEREYFARIGPEGILHSTRKPFSDENCPLNLANVAALFHLLDPPPGRLIEFGCGVGWLALFLAQAGYEVTGLDISPDAIAVAQEQARERGIAHARFTVADYEVMSPAGDHDYALFYNSLHHAEDELAALRCAHAALRPEGLLIAFEPREGHSQTPASLEAVRSFRVHEKDMPPAYIVELGRRAGFRRHLILTRPHQLMRSLYRPTYRHGRNRFDLSFRLFLSKLRVIRRLFRADEEQFVLLWK